ncbi:LexA family protein [Morganella morganii]|nr:helix-turn-helix domain-containing protein [Morganella morganii]
MKKKLLSDEQIADAMRLKAIFDTKRKEPGLSRESPGEAIGMGQSVVSQLLNGVNAINAENGAKPAVALDVSVDDFSPSLSKETRAIFNVLASQKLKSAGDRYEYPFFIKIQAGTFTENGNTCTEKGAVTWIPTTQKASDSTFWPEVQGHSMTAPQGGIEYPEPLNPRYELIAINNNCRIAGKVVKSLWPDDTF